MPETVAKNEISKEVMLNCSAVTKMKLVKGPHPTAKPSSNCN